MESRAKLLGHPIHQMLIVFPLGVLGMAVIFDIIGLARSQAAWFDRSYWMIAAGVITALIAAVFGVVDFLGIPRSTRARRVGLWHGAGNVIVVLLFIGSWLLRPAGAVQPPAIAFILSFLGLGLALITGWLGGELVDRLGVGVGNGANLDAPSSLQSRLARPERPTRKTA